MAYKVIRQKMDHLLVECDTFQDLEEVKNILAHTLLHLNFAPFVGLSIHIGFIPLQGTTPVTVSGMVYTLDFIEKELKR